MAARKAAKAVKKAPRKVEPTPAPVVAEPAPVVAAPRGPTLVTVSATEPVRVITEAHGDRERHPNGQRVLAAGEAVHFVVDPGQSLRVEEAPHV